MASVYAGIDYLLTGLPEKEALGLNILEAQACGTPVLAPDAPPFTETILDGVSGFLYRDPRGDGGADFEQLLSRLQLLAAPPDPRLASEHLARFSFEAFTERLRPVVAWAQAALRP
jgi:glycosyltransferase involved in cell wall biosynthesis